MDKHDARGKVPESFTVSNGAFGMGCSFIKSIKGDYFLWTLCRYQARCSNLGLNNDAFVPSFISVRSKFYNNYYHPIVTALVPILPYKATEYDSIFATMVNFQDVLRLEGKSCGSFWSDEGVYHLAIEIQFPYWFTR